MTSRAGADLEAVLRARLEGAVAEAVAPPALRSMQGAEVLLAGRDDPVINLCSNDYLGLASHPEVIEAGMSAYGRYGAGMASVRFICGTHELHLQLERAIADLLGHEDAMLFAAAFDANASLFEAALESHDVVVSDALNHASIIDGVRLCRAGRRRYPNGDVIELETQLIEAADAGARCILIATDGMFSMDGRLAPLPEILRLARRYGAAVMVDDCHATGVIGPQGRGSAAHFGLDPKGIQFVTGTLGKALGGGMGGFVAGAASSIARLRQVARPYLFSNALPPPLAAAALKAIELSILGEDLRARLRRNARTLRSELAGAGFAIPPGEHAIIPVMVDGDARAHVLSAELLRRGVLARAFSYPVVPRGQARIRVQASAGQTESHLMRAVEAFKAAAAATPSGVQT